MSFFKSKKSPLPFDQYGNEPQKKSFFNLSALSSTEKKNLIIASVLFVCLLLIFSISFIISSRPPYLISIDPKVGAPGDYVFIHGKHLKSENIFDKVEFAGKMVTDFLIKEWTPDQIVLRVPEQANSGLVYVSTKLGKSNGLLFTNSQHLPVKNYQYEFLRAPVIFQDEPIVGHPGELIVLKGNRFGNLMMDSSLYFKASTEEEAPIDCNLKEHDALLIEMWSDREIHFRLPDFAYKGFLFLETQEAVSRPVSLEIQLVGGERAFTQQKLALNQEFSFQPTHPVLNKTKVQCLVAHPFSNFFQTISEPVFNRPINYEQEEGQLFMSFDIPKQEVTETPYFVNAKSDVEVMIETVTLNERALLSNYDTRSSLYQYYIELNHLDKETDKLLTDVAWSLKRRESSSVAIAKANYRYAINRLTPTPDFEGSLSDAVNNRKGNMQQYAELFVALCRKSKIPARYISGFIFDNDAYVSHLWAQFYIQGFGWIDVDPWSADQPLSSDAAIKMSKNELFNQFWGCSNRIRFVSEISKKNIYKKIKLATPQWTPKKTFKIVPYNIQGFNGENNLVGYLFASEEDFTIEYKPLYSSI